MNETEKKEPKNVTGIIESVKEEICDKYCKYNATWDPEKEGMELFESDICTNCPLNLL